MTGAWHFAVIWGGMWVGVSLPSGVILGRMIKGRNRG